MELNITDFGVATHETIYDQMVEQSVELDFLLPEYCPNIARILKCRVRPRVLSKSVNGTQITVDGTVCFNLIYIDEDNKINNYDYSEQFSKSMDIGQNLENANIWVKSKSNYMNCRAVTPRKVDVHGAIGLFIKISVKKTTVVISDIDNTCVQQLRDNASITTPLCNAEKFLIIEDEIDLGQGKPSIHNILRNDSRAIVGDCKIISNKAVVKGEFIVNFLYCPHPEGRPQIFESIIPFSQIMDLDGVGENCECDVDIAVCYCELKPRTGMTGEIRSVILEAKLCVTATAYCQSEVPVLYDAFSIKYESNIKKEEVEYERVIAKINERCYSKKTLDFSENPVGTVIDTWCDVNTDSVKFDKEKLVFTGSVDVCVLGYDADGSPVYYERPVEYEYCSELPTTPKSVKCEPHIEAVAINYTMMDNGKIDVRIEINICATVLEIDKMWLLTGIEIDENKCKQRSGDVAIIIYYACGGEKIWDIARQYNTSPEGICSVNEIDGDCIQSDKMLLIPCI